MSLFKDKEIKINLVPGMQFLSAHTHFCPDNEHCMFIIRKEEFRTKFFLGLLTGISFATFIIILLYNTVL